MEEHESLLKQREDYSLIRLKELRARVAKVDSIAKLPGLTIFAAGSYGRLEASPHSDIDLFFIYAADPEGIEQRHTEELRLFGRLIAEADAMDFPAFSNDSQYLVTSSAGDLLRDLGSPADDGRNHFTLRMLMMLESRPISGDEAFEAVLRSVIEAYYRDYPDHHASFQPLFLLNDIARFWKTLLLNYENKRNQRPDDVDRNKQKVRNFKLKFSRMTTCFATVAALGAMPHPVQADDILALTRLTPRQRLRQVAAAYPSVLEIVAELEREYAWFMMMTALTEEELTAHFTDKQKRSEMFDRANQYGDQMYKLLETLDEIGSGSSGGFTRYLVI